MLGGGGEGGEFGLVGAGLSGIAREGVHVLVGRDGVWAARGTGQRIF